MLQVPSGYKVERITNDTENAAAPFQGEGVYVVVPDHFIGPLVGYVVIGTFGKKFYVSEHANPNNFLWRVQIPEGGWGVTQEEAVSAYQQKRFNFIENVLMPMVGGVKVTGLWLVAGGPDQRFYCSPNVGSATEPVLFARLCILNQQPEGWVLLTPQKMRELGYDFLRAEVGARNYFTFQKRSEQ